MRIAIWGAGEFGKYAIALLSSNNEINVACIIDNYKKKENIAGINIVDPEEKIAVIAHCNHRERAEFVKEELLKRIPFKEVVITETAGVATVYASDGGVVLAC